MENLMTMTNTEPILTQDETDVVRRFCGVLPDMGVQSSLVQAVLESAVYSEAAAQNFGGALQDVLNTHVDEMATAGVSFEIVVDTARATEIFPEDFLPSKEIVQKLLDGFWEAAREAADDI